MIRVLTRALAVLLALAWPGAGATRDAELYQAMVVITGRDNLVERERGIAEALRAVLTKVGADASAGDRLDSRGEPIEPGALVEGYDYVDRKEGIQISDEQGTRDRSFEFTVHFKPDAVDALLGDLDLVPWLDPRPAIGVALTIETAGARYRLTADGSQGYSQRLAFLDSAQKLGLTVHLSGGDRAGEEPVMLSGAMSVTSAGRWNTIWDLRRAERTDRFGTQNLSFDETFEKGLQWVAGHLARQE